MNFYFFLCQNSCPYTSFCWKTKVIWLFEVNSLEGSAFNLWRDRKQALGFSEHTDNEFAEFLLLHQWWGLLLYSYIMCTTSSIFLHKIIFLCCQYMSSGIIHSWVPFLITSNTSCESAEINLSLFYEEHSDTNKKLLFTIVMALPQCKNLWNSPVT